MTLRLDHSRISDEHDLRFVLARILEKLARETKIDLGEELEVLWAFIRETDPTTRERRDVDEE